MTSEQPYGIQGQVQNSPPFLQGSSPCNNTGTGGSSAEESLEVLGDIRSNMRQQNTLTTKKANGIPDFCSMAHQLGKLLSPYIQHSLDCVLSTEYLHSLGLLMGKMTINWTESSTEPPCWLAAAAFALSGEAEGPVLVRSGAGMASGGESSSPSAPTE